MTGGIELLIRSVATAVQRQFWDEGAVMPLDVKPGGAIIGTAWREGDVIIGNIDESSPAGKAIADALRSAAAPDVSMSAKGNGYAYKLVAHHWVDGAFVARGVPKYCDTPNGSDDAAERWASELSRAGRYAVIVRYHRLLASDGSRSKNWGEGGLTIASGSGRYCFSGSGGELSWQQLFAPAAMRARNPDFFTAPWLKPKDGASATTE